MPAELAYPIKLDDGYPCRGRDANGEEVVWGDLLREGDTTGPGDDDDCCPEARVVRGSDGLWVIWDPSVQREVVERVLGQVAPDSGRDAVIEAGMSPTLNPSKSPLNDPENPTPTEASR